LLAQPRLGLVLDQHHPQQAGARAIANTDVPVVENGTCRLEPIDMAVA